MNGTITTLPSHLTAVLVAHGVEGTVDGVLQALDKRGGWVSLDRDRGRGRLRIWCVEFERDTKVMDAHGIVYGETPLIALASAFAAIVEEEGR